MVSGASRLVWQETGIISNIIYNSFLLLQYGENLTNSITSEICLRIMRHLGSRMVLVWHSTVELQSLSIRA
jgi:hypothetical protein